MQREMWGIPAGEIDSFDAKVNHERTLESIHCKEIILTLRKGERQFDFPVLMLLPSGTKDSVPVFLAPNFKGNHILLNGPGIIARNHRLYITEGKTASDRGQVDPRGSAAHRWPIELILSRGYGIVTFARESVLVDAKEPNRAAGVRSLFSKEPKPQDWGMVATWSWSVSRVIDYLETDPSIDANRIAVKGTSRLGRMALWAGASDERIGLTIVNVSGKGATSLLKRHYGLPAREVVGGPKGHRFSESFHRYAGRIDEMPFDVHFNFALVAPRPFYVSHAEEDIKADIRGAYLALKAASPVYELLNTEGFVAGDVPAIGSPVTSIVGMHIRPGEHEVKLYDWDRYLDFADKHLK